jgi:outer membrane biosynthesis protein TonB
MLKTAVLLLLTGNFLRLLTSVCPFPVPPYPKSAYLVGEQGSVILKVKFGPGGEVSGICVVSASASKGLVDYTCDFVKAKWHGLDFANQVLEVPFEFDIPNAIRAQWQGDFPQPPYYYPGISLVLSLAFNSSGSVSDCTLVSSSGKPDYDKEAISWAKANWHHGAYSGLQVEMTLRTPYASRELTTSPGPTLIWRSK